MATAFPLDAPARITPLPHTGAIDITTPRLPFALFPGRSPRQPGLRALAQAQRRASILAAARALFDEAGSAGVTMRRLAARSGVAAPTIYKLVGGRGAVMEQALLEGLIACIEATPAIAERCGINTISAYADSLWCAATTRPGYARHLIELSARAPGGRRIGSVLRAETIGALARWLTGLCDADRIAQLGGAWPVARMIEAQFRIAFLDWADGITHPAHLRRDLAAGIGIVLSGRIDEAEQARLRDWLAIVDGEDAARRQ